MSWDTNDIFESGELESAAESEAKASIACQAYAVGGIAKILNPGKALLPDLTIQQQQEPDAIRRQQATSGSIYRDKVETKPAREELPKLARELQAEEIMAQTANRMFDAIMSGDVDHLQSLLQGVGDDAEKLERIVNTLNEMIAEVYRRDGHSSPLTTVRISDEKEPTLIITQMDGMCRNTPYTVLNITADREPEAYDGRSDEGVDPKCAILNIQQHSFQRRPRQ